MLTYTRKLFKEKGQGLTEYVLVLAFVAIIAYAMINGETGLKSTVNATFSESNSKISNTATSISQ